MVAKIGDQCRVLKHLAEPLRQALNVGRGHDPHPLPVEANLKWPRLSDRADRRQPTRHSFDVGNAEGLVDARHHKDRAFARAQQRLLVAELAGELNSLSKPQRVGELLKVGALRPVANDQVTQIGKAVTQHPDRAQHVGVAFARSQVGDRNERWVLRPRLAAMRQVGAEVHDLAALGAELGAVVGDPCAVGDHQPRLREGALHRRAPLGESRCGVVEIGAVHGDDERIGKARG